MVAVVSREEEPLRVGKYMNEQDNAIGPIVFSVIGFLVLVVVWLIGWPFYRVWSASQHGKAELAQAEYSRQIKVVEAKAKLEAEKLNAESEVIRAGGVTKANHLIKDSLNDQYIRYLWVKTLDESKISKEIIYVPTEANLPITEAGRAVVP